MFKIFHYLSSFMRIFVGYGQTVFEDKALCSEEICPHDITDCLKFFCVYCRLHFCFN